MLRLKKQRNRYSQKWAGSIARGILISSLNTISPIVKKQFLIKNLIASIRFFSVKYLLPRPLEVQYIEVAENPVFLQTFDLKTKYIISERTLINKLWGIVENQSAKMKGGKSLALLLVQGRSNTKIVGGPSFEKILATVVGRGRKFYVLNSLERLKWLWSFCFFSGIFFKIYMVFLVCQNNLWEPFSFYKGYFHKNQEN